MNILAIIKKHNRTISFENIVEGWLACKRLEVKKSSYSNYQYMINKHLKKYLYGIKIKELEKYDFNEMTSELNEELSPKTVRDIICILKSILYYAENEYSCKFKINKIISPKLNQDDIRVFNKREKNKIENYCMKKNNTKELGILMCLNTGMRIGEICALKWGNIDLEKRTIYIKQTLVRIYDEEINKTRVILDKPKTKNSIREIPISNKMYYLIKPLKPKTKDSDFFLSSDSEKYIEPRNYENTYKRVLKYCKIKPHKFHCLRHTFATDCIEVRNGYENT